MSRNKNKKWGYSLATSYTTCPKAGKIIYENKKLARQARNRLNSGLSVYSCEDHYHIGHHGNITREEHRRIHD